MSTAFLDKRDELLREAREQFCEIAEESVMRFVRALEAKGFSGEEIVEFIRVEVEPSYRQAWREMHATCCLEAMRITARDG